MILSPAQTHAPSLPFLEGGLTLLAVAIPFAGARLGSGFFLRIERLFSRLAHRRGLAVLVVGLTEFLLRLAILPILPIPKPFVPDDFSFLLAADTFASGRLTNLTPAMWQHFESIHITLQPTYMTMYFPAQGLMLALSQVLVGNPWFGTLLAAALMCAALCWMLQAWLPADWALLGGLIAVMRLGLFTYWINTFHAGGSLAALGGALVLGAFPRLIRHFRRRDAFLLAIGIALLILSRPYEGVLLCVPVLVVLVRGLFFGKKRRAPALVLRRAALPLTLVVLAGGWMAYYDYRAFGSPLTLPYTVNRNTYAMAPYYVWQKPRPEPVYRHAEMRAFYHYELGGSDAIKTPAGLAFQTTIDLIRGILFFAGVALLPPLVFTKWLFRDRRIRFLLIGVLILAAGMAIETFLLPHYLAPFTAAFYALGLQALRHLRVWQAGGVRYGMTMVRLLVTVCVLLCGVRLTTGPLHIEIPEWPASHWNGTWFGPEPWGQTRADVVSGLEKLPGGQLAIVRYSADHYPIDEWVYNEADIDRSKLIWAQEMSPAENAELMRYYKDRKVWLVQPDRNPVTVEPYPLELAGRAQKAGTP